MSLSLQAGEVDLPFPAGTSVRLVLRGFADALESRFESVEVSGSQVQARFPKRGYRISTFAFRGALYTPLLPYDAALIGVGRRGDVLSVHYCLSTRKQLTYAMWALVTGLGSYFVGGVGMAATLVVLSLAGLALSFAIQQRAGPEWVKQTARDAIGKIPSDGRPAGSQ